MSALLGVPFAFVAAWLAGCCIGVLGSTSRPGPFTTDSMDFGMVFRIKFPLFLRFTTEHLLVCSPLFFTHFKLLDIMRIPYVAINNDILHRGPTMSLKWTIDASYYTCLGVEWAGATTLHAALSNRDELHGYFFKARIESTNCCRSISHRLSPICSTCCARRSAKSWPLAYSP